MQEGGWTQEFLGENTEIELRKQYFAAKQKGHTNETYEEYMERWNRMLRKDGERAVNAADYKRVLDLEKEVQVSMFASWLEGIEPFDITQED